MNNVHPLFANIIAGFVPPPKVELSAMPGVARVDRPMSQSPLLRVVLQSTATKAERDLIFSRVAADYSGYGMNMVGSEIIVWGLGT
jgi:hypothetical protein